MKFSGVPDPESRHTLRAGSTPLGAADGDLSPREMLAPQKSTRLEYMTAIGACTAATVLTVAVLVVAIVALANLSTIQRSTDEMHGMYLGMELMNNLTNTIAQAIDLNSPDTQYRINVAFIQVLSMIDMAHTTMYNATAVVDDSIVQVERLTVFLASLQYEMLYGDVDRVAQILQDILQHFDDNGFVINIK